MPETPERTEHESAGSDWSADQRRFRWTQTHTIWILITFSLIPGVVVAFFRDQWLLLPAGVRGAIYLTSAILVVAACSLILTRSEQHTDTSKENPVRRSHDS